MTKRKIQKVFQGSVNSTNVIVGTKYKMKFFQ